MSTGRPDCRCCGVRKVVRPRGLCWTCYNRPGVRELFGPPDPRTAKYARRSGVGLGFRARAPLPEPTRAEPGSAEKLAVLAARAAAGEQLFHPDDPSLSGGYGRVRVAVVRDPFPGVAFAEDAGCRRSYPTVYLGGGGDRTVFISL